MTAGFMARSALPIIDEIPLLMNKTGGHRPPLEREMQITLNSSTSGGLKFGKAERSIANQRSLGIEATRESRTLLMRLSAGKGFFGPPDPGTESGSNRGAG